MLQALRLLRIPTLSAPARWAIAPVSTLLVVLLQDALLPEPSIAPFVFFFFAVALTAWLAGRLPGLVAVMLTAGAANYYFIPPYRAPALSSPALTATGLYLAASGAVALLCGSFRQTLLAMQCLLAEQSASEAALRRERDFTSAILDTAGALIVVLDREGKITRFNHACEALTGYAAAEVLGRRIFELLIPPEQLPGVTETWEALLHGKFPNSYENEWVSKAGSRRLIAWSNTAMAGPSGAVEYVIGIGVDVTERNRMLATLRASEEALRRSEKTFAELFERAPFGVYVVDAQLRIAQMNAGTQAGAFRNVRPVIGRDFTEAMHILWPAPVADEILAKFRHTLATGEPYRSPPFVSPRHDVGAVEAYEWELHRMTLPDGQYGVICYYYDSTELRRAEASLREADRRKDEFLAVLSHELRNPLAPIRNSLYTLQHAPPGSEQALRAQAVIERQVSHLTNLVDGLLDVTRISRGKIALQREPLDFAAAVAQTVEDHRATFVANGIGLHVSLPSHPLRVVADRTRVTQVIGNLLLNAAKFTQRGGQVSVAVAESDGLALAHVRDTGPGIAPEILPRIFEPFTQADATLDRSQGGLGLGLALVKGIVELHGGTVAAASRGPGTGAEFTVRLPLEPAAAGAGAAPPAPAQAAQPPVKRRRVLVIEDNADVAESLRDALELDGHAVALARDGRGGLAVAQTFDPEFVLCDIGLPGMDGFAVARALRADPARRGVRLVALTGYATPESVAKGREAGFDQYLTKPASLARLAAILS
jgi:PAS domain S-box-containing protein